MSPHECVNSTDIAVGTDADAAFIRCGRDGEKCFIFAEGDADGPSFIHGAVQALTIRVFLAVASNKISRKPIERLDGEGRRFISLIGRD